MRLAGKGDFAGGVSCDMVDIPFLDFCFHVQIPDSCGLDEDVSASDRGTNALAELIREVSSHDDPV